MNQDALKQAVARTALEYVVEDAVIGVGTGSTANFFIDALAAHKTRIRGTVASSEATAARLRGHGIPVFDLNEVSSMPVYIDGADEIDPSGAMIKGGGGALTREKIVASVAERFVCIADISKAVRTLGAFPLPVEVLPMARQAVLRALSEMGGEVRVRMRGEAVFVTDNGNLILDWHGMRFGEPKTMEALLNQIPGVLTNGLFAQKGASVCLLGTAEGVQTLRY